MVGDTFSMPYLAGMIRSEDWTILPPSGDVINDWFWCMGMQRWELVGLMLHKSLPVVYSTEMLFCGSMEKSECKTARFLCTVRLCWICLENLEMTCRRTMLLLFTRSLNILYQTSFRSLYSLISTHDSLGGPSVMQSSQLAGEISCQILISRKTFDFFDLSLNPPTPTSKFGSPRGELKTSNLGITPPPPTHT